VNIATGIVSFIIIWWVVIFAVLPWGVKQNHSPNVGEDPGAPVHHRMLQKVIATTLITLVIWGMFFALEEYNVISIRDIAGGYWNR
jgi:predicted secreted protein